MQDNVVERVSEILFGGDLDYWTTRECHERLAALSAGSSEPTREMIEAGRKYLLGFGIDDMDDDEIAGSYLAMTAARKGGE